MTGSMLEMKLKNMISGDQLFPILKNRKLADFISTMVLEDKTFNYHTLKLE